MKKTVILFLMLAGLAASVAAQQPTPLRCSTPCDNIPSDPPPGDEIPTPSSPFYRFSQEMINDVGIAGSTSTKDWDYVPGLIAKGIVKAAKQYNNDAYFALVQTYGDKAFSGSSFTANINTPDNANAGKIFFELYEKYGTAKYKTAMDAIRAKFNVGGFPRIGGTGSAVSGGTSYNLTNGNSGIWHKNVYNDQMWLDGLYMGAAQYAEYLGTFDQNNDAAWTDVTNQFRIVHHKTYNLTSQLNYHAWSANPTHSNSLCWATNPIAPNQGCNTEYWGRAMGWYFAALVDVLEAMQTKDNTYTKLSGVPQVDYDYIKETINQVAAGLQRWQDDASGCWYQILEPYQGGGASGTLKKGSPCNTTNYLEASASCMFTYGFLKGMRLGALAEVDYLETAQDAYKGLLNEFIANNNNNIQITGICKTAGLGNSGGKNSGSTCGTSDRRGTTDYYLCGPGDDVTVIVSNEGKGVGSFIMASLEYEKKYGGVTQIELANWGMEDKFSGAITAIQP